VRPIRITWCLAAAALVLGCEQTTEPAAQADELTEPAFKAEHTVTIKQFFWNWEDYVPCANGGEGEMILWDGILEFRQRVVDTPSGVQTKSNKDVAFLGLSHDNFMGFGQASLDVWTVNSQKSQWNARKTTKGDFETWHQNYKFALEGTNGEQLNVQGTRQEVYDKDGNLVSFHYNNGSCPQEW